MLGGIKTLKDGDYCAYCNAKVNTSLYNFCPKCGNALTGDAIRLKEQQEKRIKLELLDELSETIQDENSLKIILEKIKNV